MQSKKLTQISLRTLGILTDLLKNEITPAAIASAKEAIKDAYIQILIVDAEMLIAKGRLIDALSNLRIITQLAPDNVQLHMLVEIIQLHNPQIAEQFGEYIAHP